MYSSYDYSAASLLAGLGIVLIIFIVVLLILSIPSIIFGVLYFKKLGKKGWEAIIPFYNTFCLVEVAGLEKYWFYVGLIAPIVGVILSEIPIIGSIISLLCSVASIFATIAIYHNINKRLGKESSWNVLAILVPLIYKIIIVVDKNVVFNANMEVNPDGPFENIANCVKNMFGKGTTNNNTNYQQQQQNPTVPVNNVVSEQTQPTAPVNNTVTEQQVDNQQTNNTNNQ